MCTARDSEYACARRRSPSTLGINMMRLAFCSQGERNKETGASVMIACQAPRAWENNPRTELAQPLEWGAQHQRQRLNAPPPGPAAITALKAGDISSNTVIPTIIPSLPHTANAYHQSQNNEVSNRSGWDEIVHVAPGTRSLHF